MKRTLTIILFAVLFCWETVFAQRVLVNKNNYLSKSDDISLTLAAALDTVSGESGSVFINGYINNKYFSDRWIGKSIGKDGWSTPKKKIGESLMTGFHSFIVSFPDSFTRVFQGFVTPLVKGSAVNIIERQKVMVPSNGFDDLVQKLTDNLRNKDSSAIINELPTGLKAVLCLDFFSNPFSESASDKMFCSSFQALQAGGNSFSFRSLVGIAGESPVFALLSQGWQLSPTNFSAGVLEINDVFGDENDYKFISHANQAVNKKLRIGIINNDQNFKRIIIYTNN